MSNLDFDALNRQADATPKKEGEARNLEEFFRKKLSDGIGGNPEILSSRYQELKDGLAVELSNRELASRGDESLKKQAQADIERMTQLLNKVYFEQSANLEIQQEPLPPEPVYRGVSKPSGYLRRAGLSFVILGGLIMAFGIAGNPPLLVIGLITMPLGLVYDYFINSINNNKEKDWKRYEKEFKEYQAQHAEWVKLKEERQLRQRSSKARDEMSKFFHN